MVLDLSRETMSLEANVNFKAALLTIFLVATGIAACAPKDDGQAPAVLTPGAYDHLSAEEKVVMANVLVDEAEEKLRLETLEDAYGRLSEAVHLDKENHRAQFWKHMLQPYLDMKGIVARARPLYLKANQGQARYMALLDAIERRNDPTYRQYLLQGPNDIETDEQFREWMDKTIVSLNEFRLWIKNNKDRELELNAPSELLGSLLSRRCERSVRSSLRTDRPAVCQPGRMIAFKMNRADFEIVSSLVSMYTLHLALFYAYRTNPLLLFESDQKRNSQEYIAFLLGEQSGDLRTSHKLGLGIELSKDWAVASRHIVQAQAEFCPKESQFQSRRPKGYLFSSTFCWIAHDKDKTEKNMTVLNAIVAGEPIAFTGENGTELTLNISGFIKEPVTSLVPLKPTRYDKCGNAKEFDESAFRSLITKGSLNQYVQDKEICCDLERVSTPVVPQ